jgi:DNA-binding LytR/AlgR family response regulator
MLPKEAVLVKLFLREDKDLPETEVEIRYRTKDDEVKALISAVNSSADVLIGIRDNGDSERLFVAKILYFEAVDRYVFAYCSTGVYRVRKTLYDLEDGLRDKSFVRISRSTIVNINQVRTIAPEDSRRIRLCLKNGEYLIVARNYVRDFKTAIGMKEGRNNG